LSNYSIVICGEVKGAKFPEERKGKGVKGIELNQFTLEVWLSLGFGVRGYSFGATTFSKMTFCVTTLSMMTFRIVTFSITTRSITRLSA
jgi:hypothetical protein